MSVRTSKVRRSRSDFIARSGSALASIVDFPTTRCDARANESGIARLRSLTSIRARHARALTPRHASCLRGNHVTNKKWAVGAVESAIMTRVALLLTVVLLAGAAWAQSDVQVDLANATIADLNVAFNRGTLTAEALTELYLARIAAYDKQGPTINTVISLNPNALGEARALDAERKAGKIRGPLHG